MNRLCDSWMSDRQWKVQYWTTPNNECSFNSSIVGTICNFPKMNLILPHITKFSLAAATTHFCPYMSSPGFCLVLSFLFSFLDLYLFAVYFEEQVESWQLFPQVRHQKIQKTPYYLNLSQKYLDKPTRPDVFLRNDLLRFPGNKSSLSMKLGPMIQDWRIQRWILLLMATRNPVNSPVEGRVVYPHYLRRFFFNIQGDCLGFLNHQQHVISKSIFYWDP